MQDWILKLLKGYPTAPRLAKAKIKSVARIPYISSERARNLVAAAKKSIACTTDKITEQLVIATVKQIIHLKKVIKRQSEIMANECSIPEVELLKTFKGISDYSAIGLILNMEAVERFASTKKLASYFGIHPVYKKSGDGTWGVHMSKKGRKEPRHILFMVAMSAIKCNPLIRSIYLKHTQKGMKKMAAIGVCMHKILRIIYGMLKHNRAFDPDIDRRNREKIVQCKADVCRDKNRRYQDYDPKAPISRRQKMQRKERELSHSDKHTKSGISAPVPKAA
jgi:transposase